MRRFLLTLGLVSALASPAAAQYPAGPTNQSSLALVAPTAPATDNGNRIATTAWVNSWVGSAMPLANGKIWIGSAGGIATPQTMSGDATLSAAGTLTLGTVNANIGSFGSATSCVSFTTNAKGLITAASVTTCTPAIGSITGLGTGVATFLGTPSSANLAGAVTDETGSGALVFGTAPTISSPTINTAAKLAYITGSTQCLHVDTTGAITGAGSDCSVASGITQLTGDVTAGPGSGSQAATLASVITAGGPTGSATVAPIITYDAKGRLTTVSSATVTPAIGSVTGLGTGCATFLGTPSSANLRGCLTDETGTGLAYFQGGALGTPASGTLTSATGLPISTGLTGAGTGILAALAFNVGTAGAPVINGGALGSPSSAGTMPAFTLGGAITGGAQSVNNIGFLGVNSSSQTFNEALHLVGGTTTGADSVPLFMEATATNAPVDFVVYNNAAVSTSNQSQFILQLNDSVGRSTAFAFQAALSTTANASRTATVNMNVSKNGATVTAANIVGTDWTFGGFAKSSSSSAGVGYATGAGGAVTQATSRTTGVTLNTVAGAITLVSAAGSATPATFTVTNSAVAATDTIIVNQKSGADKYETFVTAVGAGSFAITFFTTGGTTTEQPVFNFAVIKAVAN